MMRRQTKWLVTIVVLASSAGAAADERADILRGDDTRTAIRHTFDDTDKTLLDEIQHGCFRYFWEEVGQPSGLVKDRLKGPVSSIAAVGFQLASLPIGVERGWVTRTQGEQRALQAIRALVDRDDNKKFGVYLHYPDLDTGGLSHEGYEMVASTVDHALLMAGAMVAAGYFEGDVASLVDRMIADTNWRKFATGPRGYLSMGWRLKDRERIDGPGEFLKAHWHDAADEERLVYFLAAGSPRADYAVNPTMYYRLERHVKRWKDGRPFVVSYPGCMFTYFFSHCYIDYRGFEADSPARFGVDAPRVDWFENSRRAALTQRHRAIELADQYKTFSADRWGVSPCDGKRGYIVPEIRPNLAVRDQLFEGTIAPYAAGTSIMFTPVESLAALRAYRELRGDGGELLLWRDPAKGGYGLADAFNLDQAYVSEDYLGIDHGPMLVGIENARTGLVWRLFMAHPAAKRAVERLKWVEIEKESLSSGRRECRR